MFPRLSPDKNIRKSLHHDTKVYISPWGAEPLANYETLKAVYDFCHDNYGKDQYSIHTSTNGTIYNEQIEKLLIAFMNDNAFNSIQVSLDGPEELQNYQRPTTSGNESFSKIEKFCKNLNSVGRDLKLKRRLYSFCSTIHITDDKFIDNWNSAAEYFSEPNQWHSNLPSLPMRMSGEDLCNEVHINRFVEAQKEILEIVKKRAKQGISVFDFYTGKLFGSYSCKSKNAYPYCSALNTQIAVDVDGSLYPCHGPVTSPLYKPFLWFGNLFEKNISFKNLFRNFNYQYGILWSLGKCESCPINKFTRGNICWSCPPHNLALTGEPSMDSPLKCVAYSESFKYWIAIAKIVFGDKYISEIPNDWFNNIDLNTNEFKNKKINNPIPKNVHFDQNYNGILDNAVNMFNVEENNLDCGHEKYTTSWWEFDNFFEVSQNGE
jgi:radical SAM protein with 4Fe4S-binding SPASM domain